MDCGKMISAIQDITNDVQYKTKTMANDIIKFNTYTCDTYRMLVRCMKELNIIYHTYQNKEEKACKFIIQKMHYTMQYKTQL